MEEYEDVREMEGWEAKMKGWREESRKDGEKTRSG